MRRSNKSKLCNFSSLDYMILASTLSLALAEELETDEINILAAFFAVMADELALIAAVNDSDSNDDEDVFVPPADVSITQSRNIKSKKNKKIIRKKVKKRKKT